jgi:hypothetical protein
LAAETVARVAASGRTGTASSGPVPGLSA